jgi:hypothetical protein
VPSITASAIWPELRLAELLVKADLPVFFAIEIQNGLTNGA